MFSFHVLSPEKIPVFALRGSALVNAAIQHKSGLNSFLPDYHLEALCVCVCACVGVAISQQFLQILNLATPYVCVHLCVKNSPPSKPRRAETRIL